MSTTCKSPWTVTVLAYRMAQEALPAYASRFSPHTYTQHQLFALLVLKTVLNKDYRFVVETLKHWQDMREALDLKRVPHYTTLQKALHRLMCWPLVQKMLDHSIEQARELKILKPTTRLAAGDSSGFETHHASSYFLRRRERGQKGLKNPLYQTTTYQRFPKLSVVVDTDNHLILSFRTTRGPSPDHGDLEPLMLAAWKRQDIHTALFDAGCDSERAHCFLRHDLGIRSIIPAKIGRPTDQAPTGRYRAQMKAHFPKKTYGQRWQVETVFSMIKRVLGECLNATTLRGQYRTLALKVLTHNLMILRPPPWRFSTEHTCPVCFQASLAEERRAPKNVARLRRPVRGSEILARR